MQRKGIGRWAPLLLLLSVSASLVCTAPAPAAPVFDYVFVVTTDYDVSGSTATVEALPPWHSDYNLAGVHSDAAARHHDGLIYVINRLYADNIQVLDPQLDFLTVLQFSVGPGSNPRDIEVIAADRAYVTRYESTWLYEVDPTTGAVNDSIDLAPFADADGLPEMSHLAYHDGHLFVAVERIDRDYFWTPVSPGYLAVIDVETNLIVDVDPGVPGVQGITLTGTNPYTELLVDEDAGIIYVGEAGQWGVLDGGVERIDAVGMEALGFLTTEQQLGGDVNDFAVSPDSRDYAVISVASPTWESYCVSLDRSTGELVQQVWRPGGFDVADIEVHPGSEQLFLCDRTYSSPGVRVFSTTDDHQLTSGPLFVGLPPYDLVVIGDEVTGTVGDVPGAGSSIGLSVWPNPCASVATVTVDLEDAARVRVGVYDVAGRLVRRLADGPTRAGRRDIVWDGRDERGRSVSSGVYCVRLVTAASAREQKLLVIR